MKTTLYEMQTFVTVVDNGHLAHAAERLGQTASTVSRTLSRLEKKLGATLLHRTTRRLDLTDEGRLFLDHSRRILAEADAAEAAVSRHRGETAGPLRINAAPVFMHYALVPLLAAFRARHPRIMLTLDTHDRVIDLLEHRTDIAIRIGALPDSSLVARPLGTTSLRLVASPAYLARHGRPANVTELTTEHHCLGFDVMTHLNRWPITNPDGDDLMIQPTLAASSASTLLGLALAGHGIACMADYTTRPHLSAGELAAVMPQLTLDRQQAVHAVYYRSAGTAQRINTFLDYLADALPARL